MYTPGELIRLILLTSMNQWARTTRRLTFATWLLAGIGAAELGSGRPDDETGDWRAGVGALLHRGPEPLPTEDADRDGLADTLEQELAHRYAPIVVLEGDDWTRPASIPWVLARADFTEKPPSVMRAGLVPARITEGGGGPRFSTPTRRGSDDPQDWTTYLHVYPRADGGINVQYWFYYPYNDGPSFFDHESDWEHVTVRLDREGSPLGLYLAHHKEDNPGMYRAWGRVRREGEHPVVLSARGTHASYASADDMPFFERVGACADLGRCAEPVWRTWEGGGLADLGERAAPRVLPEVIGYGGPWGASGILPGTSAPVGPTQASGFCHAGYERCKELPRTSGRPPRRSRRSG